jgi:hypothetical protein
MGTFSECSAAALHAATLHAATTHTATTHTAAHATAAHATTTHATTTHATTTHATTTAAHAATTTTATGALGTTAGEVELGHLADAREERRRARSLREMSIDWQNRRARVNGAAGDPRVVRAGCRCRSRRNAVLCESMHSRDRVRCGEPKPSKSNPGRG